MSFYTSLRDYYAKKQGSVAVLDIEVKDEKGNKIRAYMEIPNERIHITRIGVDSASGDSHTAIILHRNNK